MLVSSCTGGAQTWTRTRSLVLRATTTQRALLTSGRGETTGARAGRRDVEGEPDRWSTGSAATAAATFFRGERKGERGNEGKKAFSPEEKEERRATKLSSTVGCSRLDTPAQGRSARFPLFGEKIPQPPSRKKRRGRGGCLKCACAIPYFSVSPMGRRRAR